MPTAEKIQLLFDRADRYPVIAAHLEASATFLLAGGVPDEQLADEAYDLAEKTASLLADRGVLTRWFGSNRVKRVTYTRKCDGKTERVTEWLLVERRSTISAAKRRCQALGMTFLSVVGVNSKKTSA